MLYGTGIYGTTPYARDTFSDQSVAPIFESLFEDPDITRIYVLEAKPWDPGIGATIDRYYADRFWRGDIHASVRLVEALDVQGAIFSGFGGLSGSSVPQFGGIRLAAHSENDDTIEEDELSDFYWDGRSIRVMMGGEGFSFNQMEPIFVGKALDLSWDLDTYTVVVRDPAASLQSPIQTTLYEGTGGGALPTGPYPPEGGDDVKATPKPIAYGRPQNCRARVVDAASDVYQVADHALKAVDAVYDKGIALSFKLDRIDVYGTTPNPGEYITDLSAGLIRLGAPPEGGTITADIQGSTLDGTPTGALLETAADIVKHMVKTYGGFTDADLNLTSFADLNTDTSAPLSIYLESESPSVSAVIDEIMRSVLGFWTFTREGQLRVGQVRFRSPVAATIQASEIIRMERRRTELPFWRRKIGYGRSWTVQDADALAATSPDAHRDFVGNAYRFVSDEDVTVQTARPLAREETIETLLNDEADASTESTRQLALTSANRDHYEAETLRHQWVLRPGDTVNLTFDRWGLSGGRDMIVLSVSENSNTGVTTLALWG